MGGGGEGGGGNCGRGGECGGRVIVRSMLACCLMHWSHGCPRYVSGSQPVEDVGGGGDVGAVAVCCGIRDECRLLLPDVPACHPPSDG
jgi:hypothetical protein